MPEKTEKSSLAQIAEIFNRHQVEYIVIGGQAEILHGSARVTLDVDLCYLKTAENLRRLAAALKEMHPSLRDAPPNLPFVIDERSLALGANFTLQTSISPLDLLGWVEPIGDFNTLSATAQVIQLGDTSVRIISLEDLIKIRQYLGRPKDKQSIQQLEAILKLRNK